MPTAVEAGAVEDSCGGAFDDEEEKNGELGDFLTGQALGGTISVEGTDPA